MRCAFVISRLSVYPADRKHRWGYPFVYESYLYHLHRRDHRHNFSPYFYLTYLTYPSKDGSNRLPPPTTFEAIVRSPLISFVPQMGLSLLAGFLFARRKQDLAFTWFVQTFVFVLFNKVCTSQVNILKAGSLHPAEADLCTVFPVVPSLPSLIRPSTVHLSPESGGVDRGMGRHSSPLAQRSVQTRVFGRKRILWVMGEGADIRVRKCVGSGSNTR